MGNIPAAAILPIDNRFRTQSLELKCLGTSFRGGQNKSFQSLGTQNGRPVIKAHCVDCVPFKIGFFPGFLFVTVQVVPLTVMIISHEMIHTTNDTIRIT